MACNYFHSQELEDSQFRRGIVQTYINLIGTDRCKPAWQSVRGVDFDFEAQDSHLFLILYLDSIFEEKCVK